MNQHNSVYKIGWKPIWNEIKPVTQTRLAFFFEINNGFISKN